jgi:predicted DsbA family dithiol-disulfide isomerase
MSAQTPAKLKIDFVSDVVCPWCAVGLASLERALAELDGEIEAELHFQPFELNPGLGPEGEDLFEHLSHKYGLDREQFEANEQALVARGAAVGFVFDTAKRTRTWNTFDAHRLLHWAGLQGRQRALKHALLRACFTEGRDVGSHDVLADVAAQAGLDTAAAREVLSSGRHADDVREHERFYQAQGIRSVPSIIVNDRFLIQGGQPPGVFTETLRRIVADAAG